ncbi:hypothetical protein NDN08_006033 [Rhodosorus marinus]|uniref:Superoxide dismutase n=1 Tax=Rhodosorus marinus TaxID=101924 RepID=A0AAV8UMD9_9RHOD|nr:hypothetical protein NDN08_006033 [Rhodosorus marinus]
MAFVAGVVGSTRSSESVICAAMDRRAFLAAAGGTTASVLFQVSNPSGSVSHAADAVEYTLPPLPYPYDALEPYIDAETMKIHHDKHHKAYMNKLNGIVDKVDAIKSPTIENLETALKDIGSIKDDSVKKTLRNNGGGYYNHILYFEEMSQNGAREPSGKLADEITKEFGSFTEFKSKFTNAAVGQFGSGWAWLYRDGKTGKLAVRGYANQDSPLLDGHKPVLGCDVWEHAYYLKYNNRRPEYVEAWWNVVNWDVVAARA